jgi:hypothetical protein
MPEMADKFRLQRTIQRVRAAADWEREAQMLSSAEYETLQASLDKLAEAVDLLTSALPDDLQP